jgi:hypothetical protein
LFLQQVNNGSFLSLPAIVQDLPDALYSDTEHFSKGRYRLAFLVTSADFGIARAFEGRPVGDGRLRKVYAAI